MKAVKLKFNKQYLVPILWIGFLMSFFMISGYLGAEKLHEDKIAAIVRHKARFDPKGVEKGRTAAEVRTMRDKEGIIPVTAGMYIDRIVNLSIKNSQWIVDFYIWFRWKGDTINPGKNFQVVDGSILTKKKQGGYRKGQNNYAMYRVSAKITKFFNVSRFPSDDHLLTIKLEDNFYQNNQMTFVADKAASGLSSRVKVPGYKVYRSDLVVKPHSYKTSRGDPRLAATHKATYSNLIYGIWISRPDWGFLLKVFIGMFTAVAIALSALFLPSGSIARFTLGVGAFFAAVASTYVSRGLLPNIESITFVDIVNQISIVTIFLTLAHSIMSIYVAAPPHDKSAFKFFNKWSLYVIVIGYVMVNIIMIVAAG